MELKEITCTLSRTINLGNYESLKVEWSETYNVLPEHSTPAAMKAIVVDLTKEGLDKAIKQAMPSGGRRGERP